MTTRAHVRVRYSGPAIDAGDIDVDVMTEAFHGMEQMLLAAHDELGAGTSDLGIVTTVHRDGGGCDFDLTVRQPWLSMIVGLLYGRHVTAGRVVECAGGVIQYHAAKAQRVD